MKKILLVSNGFYPEISPRSYRATELAKEFSRQGHEVKVLTRYRQFNYAEFSTMHNLNIKMWGRSILPIINIPKRKPISFIASAFSRILLALFEYPGIEDFFRVKRILRYESDYDLMISFAVPYPVHWGTAWARTKKNKIANTWIADCGDPYMGDVLDSFRKLFYFKYFEKWFCRKADRISIPVESAKPAYYPEFHDKIVVIPQGFDFEVNKEKKQNVLNDIPTFAYAGGFLPGARDPRPLLDYLSICNKPFKFIIYTNRSELLEPYKPVLKDKLLILGFIPRERLLNELQGMDFLINFDNNTSLNVPSKLIDYAIVGKPVLNIKQELERDKVVAFLERDFSQKMNLPNPSKYHIKNITRQFLKLT